MPTTRSATRAGFMTANSIAVPEPVSASKRKTPATKAPRKKARLDVEAEILEANPEVPPKQILPAIPPAGPPPALLPATLSFSYKDAKEHLIEADERFQDVFEKNPCKVFEVLDQIEPFRTLVTSILGQQISWLAARSICHRFIRLYDPSLPEKPTEESLDVIKSVKSFFPTPQQVAATDIDTLKSAGLSTRKAEYITDLAARFADGRLSTQKLIDADDEELYEMLTQVRGIGRWTVDMFAIFSLRRPNILPVGDLGVQRGVCRWALSLHEPEHTIIVSPEKKTATPKKTKKGKKADLDIDTPTQDPPSTPKKSSAHLPQEDSTATPLATSSAGISLPPAFTPSIEKTLNRELANPPPALPDGLTKSVLKSRLDGKKVKGAILTPQEMEQLTESWKPYRSLGVYFMWSVAKA